MSKTRGVGYEKDRFVVSVPNTFVSEYLERNQRSLIEKVLRGITREEVQVQFRVDGNHDRSRSVSKSRSKVVAAQQGSLPLFNPRYTFDTFITGTSNQLAFTAALTVAQSPGTSYNPLFIYGGSGLGK
ncbi:MAG: chromosomal replication initiator protein DnaA, partial [Dehalococcoidales bacterium]